MDSSSKDTAEKKRQSKLDDEEKHRERRDREIVEERDCQRLSTYRRKMLSLHATSALGLAPKLFNNNLAYRYTTNNFII